MPHFPLFVDLSGRLCVIAGGGPVAARKARSLLDYGPELKVIAPDLSPEIFALSNAQGITHGVTLLERPYGGPADIAGAGLVIAATGNRDLNARVAEDARAACIPVNVADDPALCTFFFPALVRRGDLVAGISSSGVCPRLTSRLRERLENDWPAELGDSLDFLGEERRRLKAEGNSNAVIEELDRLISRIIGG
jgi:siroheme synthase-like protein